MQRRLAATSLLVGSLTLGTSMWRPQVALAESVTPSPSVSHTAEPVQGAGDPTTATPEQGATTPAEDPAADPTTEASPTEDTAAELTPAETAPAEPTAADDATVEGTPSQAATPSASPTPAAKVGTMAVPALLAVTPPANACAPVAVRGTAKPKATVKLEVFEYGALRPASVPKVTASSTGAWSASLDNNRCYLGDYRVKATSGTATSEVKYSRTGDAPTWTILPTQVSHKVVGTFFSNHTLVLTGKVTPASDAPVTIWEHVGTTNKVVAKVRAAADGTYRATVVPSAGSRTYFADAGRQAGCCHSPFMTVNMVRPAVSIKAPATLDSLKSTNVTGRLTAYGYSRKVELWVLVGSTWQRHSSGTSKTDGTYSLPFRFQPGTLKSFSLRVRTFAPDGTHVTSATTTLKRTLILNASVTATTSADVAKTYRAGCPVGPAQLHTVRMNYLGYDGKVKRGILIVRKDLSPEVVNGFTRGTVTGKFPIKRMDNPNVWGGNDVTMMAAGNTSAFNCRQVTGNPYRMSPHSYGKAIDINTIENPYLAPDGKWYPSSTYASYRPESVKGLLTSSSALTVGLKGQGYSWFSGWDWQHFEK